MTGAGFCCSLLGQCENDDVVNGGEGEGRGRRVCALLPHRSLPCVTSDV